MRSMRRLQRKRGCPPPPSPPPAANPSPPPGGGPSPPAPRKRGEGSTFVPPPPEAPPWVAPGVGATVSPHLPAGGGSGPTGTGKTRLSLQVASDLLDEFEHGVFFTPLDALADAALVPSAIAQSLSIKERPGQPLMETLKQHLREKQALLVLDNFEQLLD